MIKIWDLLQKRSSKVVLQSFTLYENITHDNDKSKVFNSTKVSSRHLSKWRREKFSTGIYARFMGKDRSFVDLVVMYIKFIK